jgi:uncharacterized protein involved in exopolysaccharide biosynthesis
MKSSNENIRLLKPFFRGLPIIAGVIFIALLAAKRYLKYATPMYESTAKIRLADTKDGSPSANLYKDFDVFTSATKIGGELEVLKSKVIINKTLDSLDFDVTMYRVGQMRKVELYHQSPVFVAYNFTNEKNYDKVFDLTINKDNTLSLKIPGKKEIKKGVLGKSIQLEEGEMQIIRNDSLLKQKPGLLLADHYEFIINSRQRLADFVVGNLDISSVDKEIPILRLNFKNQVPEKAANFINKLAQTYVNDYVETKCKAANTTVEFLNQQLQEVGGKLSASENAIASYRDAKNIINIRQETETDLRKIADMKVQQTNVKMNLEAIQNLEKYMVKGRDNVLELAPNFEAYTDLLATELVKKMKQLQAEKKDLLTKYTPEYEEVKNIDDKLKDISVYLEEGIRNTRKSLETKYSRISDDIDEAEKVFVGLPGREKTMGILNRNFSLNEETYNFLHGKRTEAQIARAATISFHRIISPGEVPQNPVSPNSTLIKVLAIFLGFLGSVALIYLVHAIKGKVNDNATIEKKSSVPVAANTPMLRKQQDIRSYFHKMAIQLEIKNMLPANGILALSSFSKKEGKSFNTWNLAKELAAQHKKVLVADADGSLEKYAMVKDIINVTYINLSETEGVFTNSENLSRQITRWKKEYDHILIKNEPLNNASNGLLLMKKADTNLFLLDSRRTGAKMVTEADLLQEEYSFNIMQFLLNRSGYKPNLLMQGLYILQTFYVKIIKRK